jgi:hypothetical protein
MAEHPQSIYLARLQNSCVDAAALTPSEAGAGANSK